MSVKLIGKHEKDSRACRDALALSLNEIDVYKRQPMESIKKFLQRKNIVFSAKRYGIDALGAMAQGLFCSLLIGTILNTLGSQFHIDFLTAQIAEKVPYTVGGLTSFMSGPAMAIARCV